MRRVLILLSLLAATTATAVESHAVVFMYHRFGEDRYPSTSVRLDQFEAHLDWLAEQRYQVWPLERIVAHLENGQPIPDHTVAITVDDAYLSVYREAWPRLRKRGWPFTVFVSTDPVDGRLRDYMSWAQMREMGRGGARFANHGAGHDALWQRKPDENESAWRQRVEADLTHAAARLRGELGDAASPGLFAYPYGEYDGALAEVVAALGYTGFGQHSGVVHAGADRRALPRFPMAENYASLKEFATKAAALPLVVTSPPAEPRTRTNPPQLELQLAPADLPWNRLACYEGGRPLPLTWLEPGRRLRIAAAAPLAPGRARYTCTVPDGPRYRWYTQPWLIGR